MVSQQPMRSRSASKTSQDSTPTSPQPRSSHSSHVKPVIVEEGKVNPPSSSHSQQNDSPRSEDTLVAKGGNEVRGSVGFPCLSIPTPESEGAKTWNGHGGYRNHHDCVSIC